MKYCVQKWFKGWNCCCFAVCVCMEMLKYEPHSKSTKRKKERKRDSIYEYVNKNDI